MSYIIGSKCISVCDSACVKVCPVECIHGPISNTNMANELNSLKENKELIFLDRPQLYIDPEVCIDCGACEPECPVYAIYETEEEAIKNGEGESVVRNYNFFGLEYKL